MEKGPDYKEIESYYDNFFEGGRTPYELYRSTDTNNRILNAISSRSGKLLDLGCGNGRNLRFLISKGMKGS